eukprot:766618-Hanusia_phi.AAC.8
MIVEGTGAGQTRMVLSSSGGSCSSSSYSTSAACVDSGATWISGSAKIRPETPWATPPCSDPKVDGFVCNATCTETYPSDGTWNMQQWADLCNAVVVLERLSGACMLSAVFSQVTMSSSLIREHQPACLAAQQFTRSSESSTRVLAAG